MKKILNKILVGLFVFVLLVGIGYATTSKIQSLDYAFVGNEISKDIVYSEATKYEYGYEVLREYIIKYMGYDYSDTYEYYFKSYFETLPDYEEKEDYYATYHEEYNDIYFELYMKNEIENTFEDEEEYNEIFKPYFETLSDYVGKEAYYATYHEEDYDLYEDIYIKYLVDSDPENYLPINYGQFDIIGNKNSSNKIGTTFSDGGYKTFLKLGEDEILLGKQSLLEENDDYENKFSYSNSGFVYNDTSLATLKVSANNKNATTVVVTYTITNNTNEKKEYALASSADVELGNNDEAAISKTGNSFLITQDKSERTDTYGSQLNLTLNPNPATTYIGSYNSEYYNNRYISSDVTYYTKNDGVDTVLAYSWQGEIKPGETKTFNAIFSLDESEEVTLNFYPKDANGKYTAATSDSPMVVMGGGAFKTPDISTVAGEGYNVKWNSKKDGSGISYKKNTWQIAPNSDTDFYEVLLPNTTVPVINEENEFKPTIKQDSNLIESFKDDAKTSYDDIKVRLNVDRVEDDLIESDDLDKIKNNLKSNQKLGLYFDTELLEIITDNLGEEEEILITETSKPITVIMQVPENLINTNNKIDRKYTIMSVIDGEVKIINADYNISDNELSFKTDKMGLFTLVYEDTEKKILNPNTYDGALKYIIFGIISIIALAIGYIIYRKKGKNKENI